MYDAIDVGHALRGIKEGTATIATDEDVALWKALYREGLLDLQMNLTPAGYEALALIEDLESLCDVGFLRPVYNDNGKIVKYDLLG